MLFIFCFCFFQSVLSLENLKQRLYVDLHNASSERPLINNTSTERFLINNTSTERPLIYSASTERPLTDNVSTELLPVNNGSTEKPFLIKEAVFAYIPAAEFSPDEEEVKTDTRIDEVSSAETDKVIF